VAGSSAAGQVPIYALGGEAILIAATRHSLGLQLRSDGRATAEVVAVALSGIYPASDETSGARQYSTEVQQHWRFKPGEGDRQ
jgi:hypothetical protein